MENIGSLMATMGIDISDFNKKIQDIKKSLNSISKNINADLSSIEQKSKQTFDSFGKEVQKANKVYAKLEKEIQSLVRAESMLNNGINLLNAGVINSTTFTNRYSKAINLLNSEIKNSYGSNLKYEGILKTVSTTLNTAKTRESAFSNELKRGAVLLKEATAAQEKYNRSIVANEFKRGATALKAYNAELKKTASETIKAAAAQETFIKTQHIQDVSGLQRLRTEQGLLAEQTKKTSNAFDTFNGVIKTVKAATIGYATVLAAMKITDFATGVITAGVELDSLQRSLEAITGSTQQANEEFEFIHAVADKYALDIRSVEKSYLGLLAASKKTNLEGEETRRLFSVVSGVSSVLGMSVDDTTGTLRAFIQMISKGNVQAEELRGQLGERLYGAFRLASEAMGKTTQELNDMLKRGDVLATYLIPRLTRVLENEYADALEKAGDRAGAAFIRLDNAIYELQRSIASSGVLKQFTDLAKETTNWIKANEKLLVQDVKIFFDGVAAGGRKALAVLPSLLNEIDRLVYIYNGLPDDVIGPASYGLLGKMMFGSKVGLFIGTIALINEQMSKLNMGLGDVVDKHRALGKVIPALWESIADAVSGRTDWWTGEDLTGSVTVSIDALTKRYEKLQKAQKDFDPSLGPDFSGHEKQYENYLKILSSTEKEAQKLIDSSTEEKIKKYEEYVRILEQSENKKPELIAAVNAKIIQLEQSLQAEKERLHEAAEKLSSQQADAWRSAYNSMDTITQAVYGKMLTYYAQDYEANLKLLGDKETALALYARKIEALNKKMYSPGVDADLNSFFEDIDAAANKYNKLMVEGAEVTKNMRTPTEQLADRIAYLKDLLDATAISAETYGRAVIDAQDNIAGASVDDSLSSFFADIDEQAEKLSKGDYLDQWMSSMESNFQNMDAIVGDTFNNLSSSFGSFLSDAILGSDDLGDAFYTLARGMASSMISAIGQMAAQWLVYQAIKAASDKTAQASAAVTMTANAQASSLQAGINAYSSAAAIPITGWEIAPEAMAAALAVTEPMAAQIAALSTIGMAHEGIDSVPSSGTWLLERGERVTTQNTSAKLDTVLNDIQAHLTGGAGTGGSIVVQSNPKIINVWDESMISDHISSGRADSVIINRIKKNASTIKNFLN